MTTSADEEPATLIEVVYDHATSQGGCAYLIDVRSERRVSYRDLASKTVNWRRRYDQWGLVAGQRLALSIADPIDFSLCFLAGITAGLRLVPLDHSMELSGASQLDTRARRLGAVGVVSDARGDVEDSFRPYASTSRGESTRPNHSSNTGGVILASSGSSGTPKVIALDESQLMAAAVLVARHNELGPEDRGFNSLPLFHVNAEVVGLLATLVAGASLAVDQRFHRTDFWKLMSRHDVTWINAVPAIVSRLVPLRPAESVSDAIRFCRSASAPLSARTLSDFESRTGIPIVESYGMTEAASQICANPLDGPRKPGSVGRPVGVDVRIVTSPVGESLASNPRIGSVQIRGASVVRAYDGPGYEDRFDDGWLATGDVGYLDDDGYLFLVGRNDDVINRGGEKIFPREIEELLLTHPEVDDVAVIAQPDETFGQVPLAFVSLRNVTASTAYDAVAPSLEGLRKILEAELSKARRPVTINVVDTLPTHATGKVLKSRLRAFPPSVLFRESLG